MGTVRREETVKDKNLTQSVPPEYLDAEEMLKVEDTISKIAQGENAYESMSSDNEDEVCILSPAAWSMLQSCFRRKYSDVQALKLFEEHYTELLEERKADPKGEGKGTKHVRLEVAERLKAEEGVWESAEKSFGHIPGIEIGDQLRFRAELAVVALHFQLISGIDYVTLAGKKFATSIVNSGRYQNEAKALDVLIYWGQGGNPKITDKAHISSREPTLFSLPSAIFPASSALQEDSS
ncbi:UNVERIFIED_CONTAM: Histone-lysine N-methyltransferase, H3 lysine-9 specific SUVH8 [Sesamum radiatum]|uniref:Histone-lysine N-methyltransferase, H3 lysine-9 specific SUVH8 n=1 Tax=Sesamum radiatum TaxID=300843 RepID=A0AAW2JXB4_SESRA